VKILLEGGIEPHIEFDEETNTIYLSRILNENEVIKKKNL